MSPTDAGIDCRVYRAARQPDLYVYVREGFQLAELPEALQARTGTLTEVMPLRLHAGRRLARVDVQVVIAELSRSGWFLQLPPGGRVHAPLHFGD